MQDIQNLFQNRTPGILGEENVPKSAVMLPLLEDHGKLSVLFQIRSHSLKNHPGDICFPGGHMEPSDLSPLGTALRETSEELNINPKDLTVFGPLDIFVTPSQLIIYPFVGKISAGVQISPLTEEVEKFFCIPLDVLIFLKPIMSEAKVKVKPQEGFPYQLIHNGTDYTWREGVYPIYFYSYKDYPIWGITARILHHFLQLVKRT